MSSPFTKFFSFVEAVAEKTHNLGSDTLKILLTNTAPVQTNTVKANLTEISAGNGYSAGGGTVANVTSGQALGVYILTGDDLTFTASGGPIGPFRYAVLYNDTADNDELIGWWDYGSSITLQHAETFTVDFGSTILTIT